MLSLFNLRASRIYYSIVSYNANYYQASYITELATFLTLKKALS